jgi:mannose-6-phosphate isomerase-like protein (cupin superfamily)
MTAKTVTRDSSESDARWMLGGLYEIKVSSDETGGAMTAIEFTIPANAGPPPHVHNCAELMYVLEGRARFHADGETFEAGPGSIVHFPEGTEETFEPIGETPLRMLGVYAPGGIDRFFKEAGEPAQRREVPPASEAPPDLERLGAIAEKHGLELRVPTRA